MRSALAMAAVVIAAFSAPLWGSQSARVVEGRAVRYAVEARFLLANPSNSSVRDIVYVPLPQNTSCQRSFVLRMEPAPTRYVSDEDGNVYAVVEVQADAGSKAWLTATYEVVVTGYRLEGEANEWPPLELVARYTMSTGYWDIYNETLIDIAYSNAYSDSPTEAARKLAVWVVNRVMYTVNLGRVGSDHALVRNLLDYAIVGDCTEVADVYVTMARILGLPARTAFGLLLPDTSGRMWLNLSTLASEGQRLLEHWGGHIWPQVYFVGVGWVDVDMLDGMQPNVGIYSERHVVFGVEETKYYGSALGALCIPSYLRLEYAEYTYRGEGA